MPRRKKILVVFGTRPEAIKLAPVIRELKCHSREADTVVCLTGQHRGMLEQHLPFFEIQPDYELKLMRSGQDLSHVTARVLEKVQAVIQKEKPDWVVVHGDSTTTMAASLAAYYQQVPLAHVEAGLRTGDNQQPFPEEINRKFADAIANLHFAATQYAKRNLIAEGVPVKSIVVTGNTVIDSLLQAASTPLNWNSSKLGKIPPDGRKWIVVTTHRRENFGAPMQRISAALKKLAKKYEKSIRIVYPVHRNPNIWNPVRGELEGISNITLLDPLDYLEFVHLLKKCHFVITDSGGLQEELPTLGKPALILRNKTERLEAVEAGSVELVGSSAQKIITAASRLLDDAALYRSMARKRFLFGHGHAAKKIVARLLS